MSQGLSLLSAILRNGSTVTLRVLDQSLLVGEEEHRAVEYAINHFRRYSELPTESTVEEHARVQLPIAEEHVDYYLEQVQNRHIYGASRDIFPELRDAISGTNVAGILSAANRLRTVCTPYSGQQQELLDGAQIAAEVMEGYLQNATEIGLTGVPTGYTHLDNETGGYQNGDLVTFVARPGVAKTFSLIHQLGAACSAGRSALFISNEMTLRQIGTRFAAMQAGLNPDLVRKGKLSHWGFRLLEGAIARMGEFRGLNLFAGNLGKSVAEVDMLIQELNPDIVYIDGMYLMKPSQNSQRMGRFERTAYLVDELKQQTLIHDRPIIITTQFGRAAKENGKEGTLENIGYTDTIGTHSSLVISIRQGADSREDIVEIDEEGERHITGYRTVCHSRIYELLKGREGESGEWACNFRFAPTNFEQIPMEQATTAQGESPDVSDMA